MEGFFFHKIFPSPSYVHSFTLRLKFYLHYSYFRIFYYPLSFKSKSSSSLRSCWLLAYLAQETNPMVAEFNDHNFKKKLSDLVMFVTLGFFFSMDDFKAISGTIKQWYIGFIFLL